MAWRNREGTSYIKKMCSRVCFLNCVGFPSLIRTSEEATEFYLPNFSAFIKHFVIAMILPPNTIRYMLFKKLGNQFCCFIRHWMMSYRCQNGVDCYILSKLKFAYFEFAFELWNIRSVWSFEFYEKENKHKIWDFVSDKFPSFNSQYYATAYVNF